MIEIVGGVLMMFGGGILTGSSIAQMRAPRPSPSRDILPADLGFPVCPGVPADLVVLLDRLDHLERISA